MLAQQRYDHILDRLRDRGAVRIADLVAELGVSDGTVRRDLDLLAEQGRLLKVRGGAVPRPAGTAGATPPGDADRAGFPAPGGARGAAPGPPRGADPSFGTATAGHRGEAGVIGVLVPSNTFYYPSVVSGVRAVAQAAGVRVVLAISHYDREADQRQIEGLLASGAEGVLVASATGREVPDDLADWLQRLPVPHLLMERRHADRFGTGEYVVSDHRQGAFRAVHHLASLGHRRVGLFAAHSPTAPLVAEGHAAAVRGLGLDPDAPVHRAPPTSQAPGQLGERLDALVEECRTGGTSALLVHSDQEAVTLLQRLRAAGAKVPDDIAVVAYDDEVAALAEVPLTAVAPPKREIGEYAARLLLERMTARRPLPVRQLVLQPTLVVRDSCGAPRSAATGDAPPGRPAPDHPAVPAPGAATHPSPSSPRRAAP
ncbi:substrate-binding domain-containing protein [Allostreptomyces psammosilenae]|uniref:DNA-binding LacI/PurR family transcriptional regulator n=1 Tax=Allostreptomyces psammosilenae TaxID=1892865 RepID=A0A852ZQQ3_9ACTN|nr:substrate-binding domain-containing protein [Allostreptomyces psammosilenae]NYI04776.1 DNA-binding LacI/PurR family transcriptional regulator [Allostreptomyces psammosilenae]